LEVDPGLEWILLAIAETEDAAQTMKTVATLAKVFSST
jgi:hypothetical protein